MQYTLVRPITKFEKETIEKETIPDLEGTHTKNRMDSCLEVIQLITYHFNRLFVILLEHMRKYISIYGPITMSESLGLP